MTPKSFSVRIFLQDGHADGVKIVAKSKWPGRALVIPRSSFPEEKHRAELNAPGVYILVGPSAEGNLSRIFVGSGDPVCRALEQHDQHMSFWGWVVVFASKDSALNLAHIHYLESRLLQLARAAKNANIVNLNNPGPSELSESEMAETETFLEHIISLCPLLGLSIFEAVNADQSI